MTIYNIRYTGITQGNTEQNSVYVKGESEAGGQSYLNVSDMTSRQLLEGVLIELKKLNLRQEEAFEETVNEEDVQCL